MDQKLVRCMTALKDEAEAARMGASASDLNSLISDVADLCKQALSDEDVSFALALVFDREDGIFSIVQLLLSIKERSVVKARETSLNFVSEFIEKENCLLIFRRDDSKAVQAAALSPLLSLLETEITRKHITVANLDWTFGEVVGPVLTVRSSILILLGYLVEYFPHTFSEENVNTLLKICLDTLEEQLRQSNKDPLFVLVSGVIKCLDSLLSWFDDSLPAGGSVEASRKIYIFLLQVVYYREDIKRYEVVRAGLRLLSRHAGRFALRLVEDSKDILSWLQVYCGHGVWNDKFYVANVYNKVSNCLIHEESRLQNVQERYKHFMTTFFDILDAPSVDKMLLSLAIRGVGKLSPLIVKYSGKETLEKVFHRLSSLGGTTTTRDKWNCRGGEVYENYIGHSVILIGAFADIVNHFDRVEDFMVSFIAEVTGNIFYQFPELYPKQKQGVYNTMSAFFKAMYPKGPIFSIFLSNVGGDSYALRRLAQLVVIHLSQFMKLGAAINCTSLSCVAVMLSGKVWSTLERTMETSEGVSGDVGLPLWPHYVELWSSLLDSLKVSVGEQGAVPVAETDDEHMSGELLLGNGTTDVTEIQGLVFDTIVRSIMKALTELNLKYRVRASNSLTSAQEEADSSLVEPETELENIEPLNLVHMRKYLNLVEFTQDFLSRPYAHLFMKWVHPFSCCVMELSHQYPLISGNYKLLTITITGADSIGFFQSKDLCKVSGHDADEMVTEEEWKVLLRAPKDQLEPQRGLPVSSEHQRLCQQLFRHYLQEVLVASRRSRESLSRLQLARLKKTRAQASQAAPFELTQIRIQKFLGQIGGFNHHLVPELNLLQLAGTGGLAWDSVDRLQFTIPFRDEKYDIWLGTELLNVAPSDPLLSRVVELAVSSSDRRIKVTASELLQALSLVMLGNSAKGPLLRKNEKDQSVYLDKIYKRLLPAVLRLAVDVEQVTRQLFNEFVKQLIHWFTSNLQKENPETMALLDAILDGLVDAENGSLREFCASCFGEFMSWSNDDFVNIASMLRRLYNRMDHPNPYKRLGAAMAAHRIYPVLRGNPNIVDRYIFELIFFCVKSLRLAESDDVQTGTAKQVNKTLDEYMKLVERNISALQRSRKDRPMFLTLDDFLEWLLHQSGQLQEASGSLASWYRSKLDHGADMESIIGVFNYEEEDRPFDVWSIEEARHQLAVFTRSLHWYAWALRQEMITTRELLGKTRSSFVVSSFLHRVFTGHDSNSEWSSVTPGERESHRKLVCGAIVHLLGYIRQIVDSELGTRETGVFLPRRVDKGAVDMQLMEGLLPFSEPDFFELMCLALLRPRDLGFVATDSHHAEELAKLSLGVIQRLSVVSSDFKEGLTKRLMVLLADNKFDLSGIDLSLDGSGNSGSLGVEDAMSLLKGYQQLHLSGSLLSVLGKKEGKQMGEKLLARVFQFGREFPPILETIASEMVSLSLALGTSVQRLVELCLDEETISLPLQTRKAMPGGIFYLNFRRLIVQQVRFFFRDCLAFILKAAVGNRTARLLINAVLDDEIKSIEQGSSLSRDIFLKEMILHLKCLHPCCASYAGLADKQFFLEILQKVLLLDLRSENLLQHDQSSRSFIQESFISCIDGAENAGDSIDGISDKEASITLKTHVFVLVPLFFKPTFGQEFQSRLCRSLTKVVSDNLLVREADLPKGSIQRAMYTRMLSRLLEAVSLSCSVTLLEILFPLLLDPPKFAVRTLFDSLELLSQNIGEERTACLNLCIQLLGDSTKLPQLRRAVIDRVFVSLMNAASPLFVADWYSKRIKVIVDALGKPVNSIDAETEEECLVVKVCHYSLLELLFLKVDAPLIKEKITPSASNASLMKVTMSESRAKNDPVTCLHFENCTLWRDLHISAYKALAAITLRTQEQEKVFGLLFKEGSTGMIWQHLVDTIKVYNELPVETNQLASSFQTVRGMRDERRSRKTAQGDISASLSTLSSQYVVNIGLSQEPAVISSFVSQSKDHSEGDSASLGLEFNLGEGETVASGDKSVQENSSVSDHMVDTIPSDQDDFDQHPCMEVLLKLIERLHSKFGSGNREMPEWMKALHSTLQNAGTHINIRLFLTKVVVRTWRVFAPFAQVWFIPVVQTILIDPEKSGGMAFHYMLRDICITILQWNLPCPPDPGMASEFITHLMRVAAHPSSPVLRANVDIIRMFIDTWKKVLQFDKNIILEKLAFGGKGASGTDRSVRMQRALGLQLFGAIAASGLPLYDPACDMFIEKDLYQVLLQNLNFKGKEIYEASGELIGIVLKQRHQAAQDFRRPLDEQMLEAPLKQCLLKFCRESNLDYFLNILYKITFRFPQYGEAFASLLVDLLPKLPGVLKVITLDIFLRFPSCLRSLLSMLLPTLTKILTHRDEFAQLKCLQLLLELMKDVPDQSIHEKVLHVVCETFPTHESVDCRRLYYDLLICLHAIEGLKSDNLLIRSLLAGLTDSAEIVRSTVQKFWSSILSQNLRERLSQMINLMYDPSVEENWAQFTNVLLLKLCEDSVDYKRPIFNAPLSDCEFHEYTINTSYLGGSLPMTPLFSQSQAFPSSQDSRSQAVLASQNSKEDDEMIPRQAGMIRATYTATLSQTQDTLSSYPLASQESSLFAMSRKSSVTHTQVTSQETGSSTDSLPGLRRRIPLANAARSQVIRSVLNANRRREARAAQQASERANKIHMMRSYRTGELPDIEITHADILAPLSSLAEKDATFARLLVTVICRAVYSQPAGRQEDITSDIKSQMTQGIGKALEKTSNGISFVGCIEAICLEDATIWIQPRLIGQASLKSTNFHSGILLLEQELLHETFKETATPGSSSKRQKGAAGKVMKEQRNMQEAWLELAHLYKELGEEDIVLSVYQKKLTEKPITQKALEAQLGGDPGRGLILYDQALDTVDEDSGSYGDQATQVEQDIWYNQRLACLLDLNNWQLLLEDTLTQVRTDDSAEPDLQKLWEPNLKDPYLGLFVRGAAKLSTYGSLADEFVQSSFKEPLKREVLLKNYGTQLATLAVVNDQFDRARYYISYCYKSFRNQWAALHPLAIGARHRQVQKLQKITELDEFVEMMTNQQSEQLPRKLVEWRHRWPSSKLDSVEAWDDIVKNRLVFFHKIQGLVNRQVSTGSVLLGATDTRDKKSEALASKLDQERAHIFHQAAVGLRKVGAYNAAQSYMEEHMAAHQGTVKNGALDFKFFKGLVKLRCLQADRVKLIEASEATEMLQQVLNYVKSTAQKPWVESSHDWQMGLRLLEATVSSQLAWMNLDQASKLDTSSSTLDVSLSLLGSAYGAYSDIVSEQFLALGREKPKASRQLAKISLSFGLFCDELLKAAKSMECRDDIRSGILQGHATARLPPASAYPSVIVKHMMEAISLDASVRAQHGLARVLSLVGQYPETHTQFADVVKQVPCWVFISWIPQMLAVMDQDEGNILVPVLENVAKLYPQALYFPFHVSVKDFGPQGRRKTRRLATLLKSVSLEGMVRGLEDLTFPEQRFRDGLSQMKNCLIAGDKERALAVFAEIYEDCLNVNVMRKSLRGAGEYNLKFGRDWSKRVIKALGENGSKLVKMDEKKFMSAVGDLLANLQKAMLNLQTGVMSLGHLSKWMADFDQQTQISTNQESLSGGGGSSSKAAFRSSEGDIEIPGQYAGFREPSPDLHVKLLGFDQTLICLSSKQRPKVLTMRGSDEEEYKFVVKGGEDLRLDQRIEQLFEVMNSILQRDSQAARRGLTIRTFAVVPVSKSCGLLQFVENTCVLEDVIKDGLLCKMPNLRREGKDAPLAFLHKLRAQYHEWIMKRGGPSQAPPECYRNMYQKATSDEVTQKMSSIEAQMPWDTFRAGVSRWATSAESFLALRSQFAKSLSVISICGYVAGVGDRHLANTLVDMRTGALVPIDFGYSFGTGVILLPVPELIPFRLTNQLLNFLLPLDALGLLRTDMVHTLAALHASREVISAVMDVFVKEPLVDWKNEAMKTSSNFRDRKDGAEMESTFEQQHVELKVENAQRKLELWNPAAITIAELRSSVHARKPYSKALESIVRGSPDRNMRARTMGNICQSIREQVDCLIDQATDPNLLGRIWQGWQPWV
ncbi:hypothetical protein AXG93_2415s1380 [Marchantia polymorpha subsp. ruderalis]|uniref:DNA-dependent protein kinase catalytic subunit n=1 Tax=Marchantia polymorpha subsp. ruderalis TaxID=1480154 RepID=A0A176VUS1_MARPO|nr:hypothetical protein AXG93_2415s1380 [Marchantia polymorpha subsp. ruderalis]